MSSSTFKFDGTRLVQIEDKKFFNVGVGEWESLEQFGFKKVDQYSSDGVRGIEVWQRNDKYAAEICLDGDKIYSVEVGGFPQLMDFIHRYGHPLMELVSMRLDDGGGE